MAQETLNNVKAQIFQKIKTRQYIRSILVIFVLNKKMSFRASQINETAFIYILIHKKILCILTDIKIYDGLHEKCNAAI